MDYMRNVFFLLIYIFLYLVLLKCGSYKLEPLSFYKRGGIIYYLKRRPLLCPPQTHTPLIYKSILSALFSYCFYIIF